VTQHTAPDGIDHQPLETQHRGILRVHASRIRAAPRRGCTEASQHRLHPRHQLAGLEGLGQVVVSAHFQAHHAIGQLSTRRQHDDRHLATLPDPATDLETVHLRQHDVENRRIEIPLLKPRQPL